MDEVTLIRATIEGRLEEFGTLVERHQRALHAFVVRETDDPELADEIVQASFFRAWEALPHFRFEASFRSWLHEIALVECRVRRRTRRATREDAGRPANGAATTGPDDPAADHAALVRELERLSARPRRILFLRVLSDLPFREIARLEGLRIEAAKVRYHDGVVRLERWLR